MERQTLILEHAAALGEFGGECSEGFMEEYMDGDLCRTSAGSISSHVSDLLNEIFL